MQRDNSGKPIAQELFDIPRFGITVHVPYFYGDMYQPVYLHITLPAIPTNNPDAIENSEN